MAFGWGVSELALMGAPLCAGILLNTCNLILTLLQMWSSRKALAVSAIICSISCGNVLLGLACMAVMLLVFAETTVISGEVNPLFSAALFFWMNSCFVSFWSIAWLSVFYCVTVVSFSMEWLKALKRSISSLTGAALLVTLIGSWLLFSPFFTLRLVIVQLNTTDVTNASATQNQSYSAGIEFAPWIDSTLYTATFIFLLCPLPLMVMLPTSLRLVLHLCRHMLALRRNQTQCQSSDSYLLVCKLTVSLVGVYVITLLIVSLFFISKLQSQSAMSYDVIMLGCTFYCVASGGLVTASNRHLKEKLRCGACWTDPPDQASKSQTRDTALA